LCWVEDTLWDVMEEHFTIAQALLYVCLGYNMTFRGETKGGQ